MPELQIVQGCGQSLRGGGLAGGGRAREEKWVWGEKIGGVICWAVIPGWEVITFLRRQKQAERDSFWGCIRRVVG